MPVLIAPNSKCVPIPSGMPYLALFCYAANFWQPVKTGAISQNNSVNIAKNLKFVGMPPPQEPFCHCDPAERFLPFCHNVPILPRTLRARILKWIICDLPSGRSIDPILVAFTGSVSTQRNALSASVIGALIALNTGFKINNRKIVRVPVRTRTGMTGNQPLSYPEESDPWL